MLFIRGNVMVAALLLDFAQSQISNGTNLVDYVNPFIGTQGTVPGTSYNG